jgi:D-citramalate synthase
MNQACTQGLLSNPLTYEPFAPELVGATRRLSPGKHSGSHAIRATLDNLGLKPSEEQFKEVFKRIKELGDKGKSVMDADVLAIAEAAMGLGGVKPIQLEEMTYVGGDKVTSTASVRLKLNGKSVWGSAVGVGPVDATINAVKDAVAETEPITLEQYNVKLSRAEPTQWWKLWFICAKATEPLRQWASAKTSSKLALKPF